MGSCPQLHLVACHLRSLIPVVITASVLIGCDWIERFENPESFYPTYQHAKEAGGIREGGYLPDFIPESAVDIQEIHDIDTNRTFVRFEMGASDIDLMTEPYRAVPRSRVQFPKTEWRERLRLSWWPESLTTDLANDPGTSVYRFFGCDRVIEYRHHTRTLPGFIAVDSGSGTVFYWCLGG